MLERDLVDPESLTVNQDRPRNGSIDSTASTTQTTRSWSANTGLFNQFFPPAVMMSVLTDSRMMIRSAAASKQSENSRWWRLIWGGQPFI